MITNKLKKMHNTKFNKWIPAVLILLLLGASVDAFSQNRRGRGFYGNTNQTCGYCLTNVQMTAEQKARVDELQKKHQSEMAVYREKVQSTRDWSVKEQARAEMDVLRAKNQQEIWSVVPEAKNQALNLRQARGYGKGMGRGCYRGGGRGR